MSTVVLTIDERTVEQLAQLSIEEGIPASEVAARLLRRALRAKRPRPVFDVEAVREQATLFADEDTTIAESGREHRSLLLLEEDIAE